MQKQRKQNIITFSVLLICLILVGAFFANMESYVDIFNKLFSREIKQEENNIKTIEKAEEVFISNEDKKVGLEKFYLWTKIDPLLYSSTIKAERVSGAMERLEAEEKFLVKNQQLHDDLFPLDFLNKFMESSKAFHEFDQNISAENAEMLLVKMKEAHQAYQENLEQMEIAVSELQKDYGVNKIAFLGGDTYTTIDLMLSDFQKMKKNASKIKEEIERREKCLMGYLSFCETDFVKKDRVNLESMSYGAENQTEPKLLSTKLINLPQFVAATGPFEINSACWGTDGNSENYLYVTKECNGYQDYCMQTFHLANRAYFTLAPNGVFGEQLKNKGIELIPQRATNPYTCADLEYQANLATLNYFLERYASKPLFEKIMGSKGYTELSLVDREIIANGDKLEKEFFTKKYPSDKNLEELTGYYERAYFSGVNDGLFSEEITEDLLERILIQKEKMVDFDLLVNTITYFLEGFRMQMEPGNGFSSKDYIYAARSNYSLFYLNFSDSVWRLQEKPEYLKIGERRNEPLGIYNYEEAVSRFGESKLLEWIDMYNKFEDRHFVYKRELEKKQ